MALVPRLALAVSGGMDTDVDDIVNDADLATYLPFEQGDLIEILHEPLVGDVYVGCVREVQGSVDAACLDWPKSNFDDGMHGPEDSETVLCEYVAVVDGLRLVSSMGEPVAWQRIPTTNSARDGVGAVGDDADGNRHAPLMLSADVASRT